MRKLVSLSISIFTGIVSITQALSIPTLSLKAVLGDTANYVPVLTNNNDPAILYSGNWVITRDAPDFYLNDFRASNTQYNRCLFTFRGSFVKWYGSKNNYHGLADIYIDDVLLKSVDTYNATLITNSLLFEADGLKTDRLHTLAIVVRKEKNEKSIGCFQDIDYFESAQPINYAEEITNLMNSEYAQILDNTKAFAPPASWTPVSYVTNAPVNGVTLQSGMFNDMFTRNIQLLNNSFSSPTYCYGVGWSNYLPASVEGRLLSGAANTLRWGERADMRNIIDTIINKIKNRVRQDGYHNYYSEELYTLTKGADSERKNYDRVFWTRGLLDAGKSGNSVAYSIARNYYDWFNQSPYLANMLLGSNSTNGFPGGGLMYLSPVGVKNDLIVTMKYFDQDYWIDELIKRQPLCISNYPGMHPHCYELLGLEAFLDEYIATGLQKYIDAVKGGWEVYNTNFENIGGTTAIGEGNYYPPRSYYLYPTRTGEGETCGSVFWTNINSKLLHLYPDEEKYASEIEKSIYNVLMAAQDSNGNIGGYNHLHGQKEINSHFFGYCCEASTESMISSKLPEYIFSIAKDGLYINLFTASTISLEMQGTNVTLKMITEFPRKPGVMITVVGTHNKKVNIRVRVPSWAIKSMEIKVNGKVVATGTPGSYVSLNRRWMDKDKISFVLPIALTNVKYTGLDQINGNMDRYALLYGPILMALKGPLKGPDGVPHISTTLTGLPNLLTTIKERPLQFNVEGYPAYKYVPYWWVSGTFTCFPIIQP
jgi:uncharacterized protein